MFVSKKRMMTNENERANSFEINQLIEKCNLEKELEEYSQNVNNNFI